CRAEGVTETEKAYRVSSFGGGEGSATHSGHDGIRHSVQCALQPSKSGDKDEDQSFSNRRNGQVTEREHDHHSRAQHTSLLLLTDRFRFWPCCAEEV